MGNEDITPVDSNPRIEFDKTWQLELGMVVSYRRVVAEVSDEDKQKHELTNHINVY